MKEQKQQIYKTINALRFPLTVAVVFIHFNIARKGISLHGINYGIDNPYLFHFIIELISNVMACIAVPMFFFFSGYLFFKNHVYNRKTYKEKLISRAQTLLIPYIIWNVIALGYQAMKLIPLLSTFFPGAYRMTYHFSIERLFNTFFCCTLSNGILISPTNYVMTEVVNEPYPINVPMWYIRDLMLIVICSPLVYMAVKKMRLYYIYFLGGLWFTSKIICPQGGFFILISTALFFFSWGAYYSIKNIDFTKALSINKFYPIVYAILVVIDTLTISLPFNLIIHNTGILIGIITAIGVTVSFLKENDALLQNRILLNSTFFIYALHKIIIDDIGKILFLFFKTDNTFIMLGLYFLTPTITILFCIASYKILNKFVPRFCKLLTGGR